MHPIKHAIHNWRLHKRTGRAFWLVLLAWLYFSRTSHAAFVYLDLEAESGTPFAPITVGADAQASGGEYIFTPTSEQGRATYSVNIASAGNYYLWWRALAPNNGANSFYLNLYSTTVNTDSTNICDIPPQEGWRWARVNQRPSSDQEGTNSTDARVLQLTAGPLDFVIGGRENETGLDRILLTNDPDFVPTDRPPVPEYLYLEAESGTEFAPLTVGTDAQASGGQYIFTPTSEQGRATYSVNIASAGNYYLWWRALAPSSGANSFYLNLNSSTVNTDFTSICDIPPQAGWQWARVNQRPSSAQEGTNSSDARVLPLAAGPLDFVIGGREPGTGLDLILLTSDPDFVPTDSAEIRVSEGSNNIADDQSAAIDFGTVPQGQPGSSVTFGVFNDGAQTLTLGTVSVPAGFTLTEGLANSLAPGQQDTFTVQLDTATPGAKSGQITLANNDSDENPFSFPVTGLVGPLEDFVYVDLEAESGTQFPPLTVSDDAQASGGQYIFAPTTDQGQATYTVNIARAGNYRMWWRSLAPNPSSNSFYLNLYSSTVNTDSTNICDIPPQAGWQWARVNQRPSSAQEGTNSADARVLSLAAGPLEFVIGGRESGTCLDRILITSDRDFVPTDTPEIRVSEGLNDIADDQIAAIDFGTAAQGQPGSSVTFSVFNDGAQTLTLGTVSVPAGFILTEELASSLAPGGQDTFTVQLDTAAPGTKSGQVTFANNDSDENPFNFPVTGVVGPLADFVYVDLEAESGTEFSPLTVGEDVRASEGQYIFTPTSEQGQATYTVNVDRAGNYYMWWRALAPNPSSNSFYLNLNSSTVNTDSTNICDIPPQAAWQWARVNQRPSPLQEGTNRADARVLSLAAGPLEFVIGGRESGTCLDRILLTSDRDFVPTNAPVPPQILTQPADVTVREPAAAMFSVQASGTPPLSYQWRREGMAIGAATAASYLLTPTSSATDNGAQFDVVVNNAQGSVTSRVATLTVLPSVLVLEAIAILPSAATITNGGMQQFRVIALFADGNISEVTTAATFTSSNPAVATVITGGLATGISPGTTTIAATFETLTDTATLMVQPPPVLQALSLLPPTATITNGGTQQFMVFALYSDGTSNDVTATATFVSSNLPVATVTAGGLATGLAPGTAIIAATFETLTATATLTVQAPPPVLEALSLLPPAVTITNGGTQQFMVFALYSDGASNDVTATATFVSSNLPVATVTPEGLATGLAPGTAIIAATFETLTATATLTVQPPPPVLQALSLLPPTATITNGGTQQYVVFALYSDGTSNDVTATATFVSSNLPVATVTPEGLATGLAPGTAIIAATFETLTATATLTVQLPPPVLEALSLLPPTATITNGGTQQYVVFALYSDGTSNDVTATATFVSSNLPVATVTPEGLATGLSLGTAVIAATFETLTATATLTVQPPPPVLQALSLLPPTATITNGGTQQYVVFALYSDGSSNDVTTTATFTSSNTTVAIVMAGGLAAGVAPGTATIAATFETLTATAVLTVRPLIPTLDAISILPPEATITNGGTQQFMVFALYSDGSSNDVTSAATFISSNPPVATVIAGGLATGVLPGTAIIAATVETLTATATLTVLPTGPVLEALSIDPPSATITNGGTQQFMVFALYSDGSSNDVTATATFTSSNPAVAMVVTGGLATGVSPGTTTIAATFETLTATAMLTVLPAGPVVEALSILPPTATITNGGTQQYMVFALYSDANIIDVTATATFVSSNLPVATVSAGGLATGLAPGTAIIAATFETLTATATLTVQAPPVLEALALLPPAATITNGGMQQFMVFALYSDGTSNDVTTTATFVSSNELVATVTPEGLATGLAPGMAIIAATFETLTATATLTVQAPPPILEALSLLPPTATITNGGTQQFMVFALYSDGTSNDVTTTATLVSSNELVATVSAGGLATGLAPGMAIIAATFETLTATATLTVQAPPPVLEALALLPPTATITNGGTQQFMVFALYSDGTSNDVTTTATFVSSNLPVATVTPEGLATGLAPGTAIIAATFETLTATATLTVQLPPPVLEALSLLPPTATITNGGTQQFMVFALYSDGTSNDVTTTATFVSSNLPVATVTPEGLATGLAPGTAIIAATFETLTATATLTVQLPPPVLEALSLLPPTATITNGGTQQYVVFALYSDGTSNDVTATATFVSSNLPVATVTPEGLATGLAPGTAIIAATFETLTATATLTVQAPPPVLEALSLLPPTATITNAGTQQYVVFALYSDGTSNDVTATATFVSSNLPVATVTPEGLVTGLSLGTAIIAATFETLTATATLTVQAPPPVLQALSLLPPTATITNGGTQQYMVLALYSDGTSNDVTATATFASSDQVVAAVTPDGLATGLSPGTTIIAAIFETFNATATLTVQAPPPVLEALSLLPPTATIANGGTQQYMVFALYSDGTSNDVTTTATFVSSNLPVVTVTAGGLATGLAPGTAIIAATFDTLTATATLTVQAPPPVLEALSILPPTATITNGGTQQFMVFALYSDGTSNDVTATATFVSSNEVVATVTAGGGLATGLSPGTAIIAATFETLTATATLTVQAPPPVLEALSLLPPTATITNGGTQQYVVFALYSDGTSNDVTATATFVSSNLPVATVTPEGLATGLALGTAIIAATFETLTATATLTVQPPPVLEALSLLPPTATITNGGTQQYVVFALYSDGTSNDVTTTATFVSSNEVVATVTAGGLATGLSPGTAIIAATFEILTATATLTVQAPPPVLEALSLLPPAATITNGGTQQFMVFALYSDGTSNDVTATATFVSSNLPVATVTPEGLATGLSPGTAIIAATFETLTATATLTVQPPTPVLEALSLLPPAATIPELGLQQFMVFALYSDGTSNDVTLAATFTSSNPAVAIVMTGGVAGGISPGMATIAATFETLTATAMLTVRPALPILEAVSILPPEATITNGGTQQFMVFALYSNGTSNDVTSAATFISSNPPVATVIAGGLATGVLPGTAIIAATVETLTGTATLTVLPAVPVLDVLSIDPPSATITNGGTQQFTVSGSYSDGTTNDLTPLALFSSSNMEVATIAFGGLATGVSTGSVTITAEVSGLSVMASLTVGPAEADLPALAPALSPPRLEAPRTIGNQFKFSFRTVAGYTYSVEYTSSLQNPIWVSLANVRGDGRRSAIMDAAPDASQRFYRVRILSTDLAP